MNNKIIVLFLILLLLVGFTSCKDKEKDDNGNKEEIILEKTSYTILTGTLMETTVYEISSSVDGPRIAIIGGTHGDEVAGWRAGLKLIEKEDFRGEILIIPQCNILADDLYVRYPGVGNGGMYEGTKYSDLNRTFPGNKNGTDTEKLANAIISTITNFAPDHVIDLHESKSSVTNSKLGNEIIYGNKYSSLAAVEITENFNELYLKTGEEKFYTDTNAPAGSFNNYWGGVLTKGYVFTIETNRELDLSRRIEQQLGLLDCIFDYIWNK